MKVLFLTATLLATVLADTSTTSDLLWPQPSSQVFGSNVYSVDSSLKFIQLGGSSDLLKSAFGRYQELIFKSPAPFYPSGGAKAPNGTVASLTVTLDTDDETLRLETDESYKLFVTAGVAEMNAKTVYGALRGLETFSQLIYRTPDDKFAMNEVKEINDVPRFNFRGTMVDTSRHFLNTKSLIKHLDAMSYNKVNVLHWHIVDDQSFPYASITFPNITKEGAFDDNHVYSQSDIAMIIQYAMERGIRVIPEFDSPGHSQSWGHGQPDLLTPCYNKDTATGSYGPINPLPESTWTFMEAFYKEITEVFKDEYIHLGGDEVSFGCWQSNPEIQKWMATYNFTNYAKLEEYYETNLITLVDNLQKSYVVWQEIFDNGLKIKKDTVIDVWKSYKWQEEMYNITKAGYKVILSACWYLNYISYGEDWEGYYKCDPQDFNGSDQQNEMVVGGHACIWNEFVDSTNFLSRYWPRASAVAERLWSPKTVVDIGSASTRLRNQKCRMISRGIPAEPADGPGYCSYEWPEP